MGPEALRYWLPLAIGAPQAVLWFGFVALLAHRAARGDSPRPLRRLAVAAAVLCGAVAAAYGLLLAWRPDWYDEWVGDVAWVLIAVSFAVALSCAIWRINPPASPEERRLALVAAFYFGGLSVGLLIATKVVMRLFPGWYDLLLLVPYGVLVAVGSVTHHRALRRIREAHAESAEPSAAADHGA